MSRAVKKVPDVIDGHFTKSFVLSADLVNKLREAHLREVEELRAEERRKRRKRVLWSSAIGLATVAGSLLTGVPAPLWGLFLLANGFYITNTVAAGMLNATGFTTAIDAGSAAVINIYDSSVPANADASIGGSTLLAQLTCDATAVGSPSDTGTAARLTFDAITQDSSADNNGTASYFRILTQSGGTVIAQGTVGTSSADLVLNTTSITSGSTVSISAATIDLPEGP